MSSSSSSSPSVLPLVKSPSSLQSKIKYNSKKTSIINHINTLLGNIGKSSLIEECPLISHTRLKLSMTDFTCNLIENLCPKKNKGKYDKKQLALDVLTDIYNLTEAEKKTIEEQIDYIYEKDLIVRIPVISKFVNSIIPFVKKNFLLQNT
jgi:hypothetical protein